MNDGLRIDFERSLIKTQPGCHTSDEGITPRSGERYRDYQGSRTETQYKDDIHSHDLAGAATRGFHDTDLPRLLGHQGCDSIYNQEGTQQDRQPAKNTQNKHDSLSHAPGVVMTRFINVHKGNRATAVFETIRYQLSDCFHMFLVGRVLGNTHGQLGKVRWSAEPLHGIRCDVGSYIIRHGIRESGHVMDKTCHAQLAELSIAQFKSDRITGLNPKRAGRTVEQGLLIVKHREGFVFWIGRFEDPHFQGVGGLDGGHLGGD